MHRLLVVCRTIRFVIAGAAIIACGSSDPVLVAPINEPFQVAGVRVPAESINAHIVHRRGFTSRGGEMRCAYQPLGQEEMRVFVWAMCLELLPSQDKRQLLSGSGMSLPVALQIETRKGQPYVVASEVPSDGSDYSASIRRIFPESLLPRVFPPTESANARGRALASHLQVEAVERFGLPPEAARTAPLKREIVPIPAVVADQCYRSSESVLLGPPTGRRQRGHRPGWILLKGMATRAGAGAIVDGNGSGLHATWRRLSRDSLLVHGADDFLRTELRVGVTAESLSGRGYAYSDAAAERDSSGRLGDLRREWAVRAVSVPCDSLPSRWRTDAR